MRQEDKISDSQQWVTNQLVGWHWSTTSHIKNVMLRNVSKKVRTIKKQIIPLQENKTTN